MQVVLLQILLWILRIMLFLLFITIALIVIVMIVPIRYQVEGDLHEKKPGVCGKITWFFYLINMNFSYENEFHIIVRVLGFKVYDSLSEKKPIKKKKTREDNIAGREVKNKNDDLSGNVNSMEISNHKNDEKEQKSIMNAEEELAAWEKEVETEEKEEAELAKKVILEEKKKNVDSKVLNNNKKSKKSLDERIEEVKRKVHDIVNKIKDILKKIQDGKLKVEHYLDLWNRKETQITFQRAKKKFGKVCKTILPRKWRISGTIGFEDPSITGKLMGGLGAMYPILGNNVQIVPEFEDEALELDGKAKGYIRLGNLVYQLITLLLNPYCFKFIKLVFDELGGSKKRKKEI